MNPHGPGQLGFCQCPLAPERQALAKYIQAVDFSAVRSPNHSRIPWQRSSVVIGPRLSKGGRGFSVGRRATRPAGNHDDDEPPTTGHNLLLVIDHPGPAVGKIDAGNLLPMVGTAPPSSSISTADPGTRPSSQDGRSGVAGNRVDENAGTAHPPATGPRAREDRRPLLQQFFVAVPTGPRAREDRMRRRKKLCHLKSPNAKPQPKPPSYSTRTGPMLTRPQR